MKSPMTIYLLLLNMSLYLLKAQYIEPEICSNKCLCLPNEGVVVCHEAANIRALPTNIDKSKTKFIVQRGNFDHPALYRHNLTGLEHLTFLKIIYYNLNHIGPRAFIGMTKLLYLDVSHNKLINIASLAFTGLRLFELHVMENENIKFFNNAFYNMTVELINMRSNNLTEISYDLLQNTKVKNLFLYNNSISVIDSRFNLLFNDSDKLLDVSNNPLYCDCSLSWLAQILAKRFSRKSPQSTKTNITCSAPTELLNRELMFLNANVLKCSPLRIKKVKLHLNAESSELSCVSSIGGAAAPSVTWLYYRSDLEKNVIKGLSTVEHLQRNITSTTNTINLTTNYFKKGYSKLICIASANGDLIQRLEIHIHKYHQSIITTTLNKSILIPESPNETTFLFVKHFSILEMLGAVLGTFTVTFIGLIMLLRYMRSYQDKLMNKSDFVDMHRSINSIKPYWYVPNGNSSTYSMPNSHPEYESPTIFEKRYDVTNTYSSYPANRSAYLDFKTHNLIVT